MAHGRAKSITSPRHYRKGLIRRSQDKPILDDIRLVLKEMDQAFEHANDFEAQNIILSVAKDMVDMEIGALIFALTGQETFLQPYINGDASRHTHFAALKTLVNHAYDIDEQRRSLNKIEDLAQQWLLQAGGPEMAAREEMNLNTTTMKDVIAFIEQETGKNIMDILRGKLLKFRRGQENLMLSRQKQSKSTANISIWIGIFGTGLIIAFAITLLKTTSSLQKETRELEMESQKLSAQDWLKTGQNNIADLLRGNRNISILCNEVVRFICSYLNCHIGKIYVAKDSETLELVGMFGVAKIEQQQREISTRHGLIGEVLDTGTVRLMKDVPTDFLTVETAAGKRDLCQVLLVPYIYAGRFQAFMELGTFVEFDQRALDFMQLIHENVSIGIDQVQRYQKSQQQATELEDRSNIIDEPNESLFTKLVDLENANMAAEVPAVAKSEFLSVVSHELRMPMTAIHGAISLMLNQKKCNWARSNSMPCSMLPIKTVNGCCYSS